MADVETSLPVLLGTLTDSLVSATSSFPSSLENLVPSADAMSLLNTKNDLLLSYLQNLVFLIILKLKSTSGHAEEQASSATLSADSIKKLIELRVYIEKGVRPLEGRLKYQIEKVLRAADDAERATTQKQTSRPNKAKAINGHGKDVDSADSADPETEASETESLSKVKIDDLSYRPRPAALLRTAQNPLSRSSSSTKSRSDGTYKPPRINPTAMPLPQTTARDKTSRRNQKSHLLEEYVSSELSSAPLAEPSIGSNSTILKHGRSSLSSREREKRRERLEYEEQNFSRLPVESKAERRKARARGEGDGRKNQYGGEDWTGLGEFGNKVARSVARKSGSGAGQLERREKRRREGGGSEGGGGARIGDIFEKRRKVMEARAEKKRR